MASIPQSPRLPSGFVAVRIGGQGMLDPLEQVAVVQSWRPSSCVPSRKLVQATTAVPPGRMAKSLADTGEQPGML